MHDDDQRFNINYGSQQSGGISYTGTSAIGPNAFAFSGDIHQQTTGQPTDGVEDLLRELERCLRLYAADLPYPARDETSTDVEHLRRELAEQPVNLGRVSRLLDRLSILVQPIGPLANAVAALASAFRGG